MWIWRLIPRRYGREVCSRVGGCCEGKVIDNWRQIVFGGWFVGWMVGYDMLGRMFGFFGYLDVFGGS